MTDLSDLSLVALPKLAPSTQPTNIRIFSLLPVSDLPSNNTSGNLTNKQEFGSQVEEPCNLTSTPTTTLTPLTQEQIESLARQMRTPYTAQDAILTTQDRNAIKERVNQASKLASDNVSRYREKRKQLTLNNLPTLTNRKEREIGDDRKVKNPPESPVERVISGQLIQSQQASSQYQQQCYNGCAYAQSTYAILRKEQEVIGNTLEKEYKSLPEGSEPGNQIETTLENPMWQNVSSNTLPNHTLTNIDKENQSKEFNVEEYLRIKYVKRYGDRVEEEPMGTVGRLLWRASKA